MVNIYYVHVYIRIKTYRMVEVVIPLNILIEMEGVVVGQKQWFLTEDNSPPETVDNSWGHFLVAITEDDVVLLASSGSRSGMLLNILRCTGHAPSLPHNMELTAQMSTVTPGRKPSQRGGR